MFAWNARDQGSISHWGTEFLVHRNPLLYLMPNVGLHWLVWSKREDMLSPEGNECHSRQLPCWSGGYDAHPECERLGLDPLLRHWIFQSSGTHSYSNNITRLKAIPMPYSLPNLEWGNPSLPNLYRGHGWTHCTQILDHRSLLHPAHPHRQDWKHYFPRSCVIGPKQFVSFLAVFFFRHRQFLRSFWLFMKNSRAQNSTS